jgi:hypothetical protein
VTGERGDSTQALARQRHQPLEIVIHQRTHGFALPVFDLGDPLRDRIEAPRGGQTTYRL